MRGDLAGEIVAHAADLHEPAEGLCVLVKKREVGRATADCLEDSQEASQHGMAFAGRGRIHARDCRQDPRQERRKTAPPELVESPEVSGLPQLEQHAGSGFRIGQAKPGCLFSNALQRRFGSPECLELRRRRRFSRAATAQERAVELRGDGASNGFERVAKLRRIRIPHR